MWFSRVLCRTIRRVRWNLLNNNLPSKQHTDLFVTELTNDPRNTKCSGILAFRTMSLRGWGTIVNTRKREHPNFRTHFKQGHHAQSYYTKWDVCAWVLHLNQGTPEHQTDDRAPQSPEPFIQIPIRWLNPEKKQKEACRGVENHQRIDHTGDDYPWQTTAIVNRDRKKN